MKKQRKFVSLDDKMSADAAAIAVLRPLCQSIKSNLQGVLEDTDIESLHDFRVAVRRSRCVLGRMKKVLRCSTIAVIRSELSSLSAATGPTRDLDIQLIYLPKLFAQISQDVADRVRGVLRNERSLERNKMLAALGSEHHKSFMAEWSAFLKDYKPSCDKRASKVIRGQLSKIWEDVVRQGAHIDDVSDATALHELRKTLKQLRYMQELFGDLFPGRALAESISRTKQLQDVLGLFQDLSVQLEEIDAMQQHLGDQDPLIARALPQVRSELLKRQKRERAAFARKYRKFVAEKHKRSMHRLLN